MEGGASLVEKEIILVVAGLVVAGAAASWW